jgi:hypothetical protein
MYICNPSVPRLCTCSHLVMQLQHQQTTIHTDALYSYSRATRSRDILSAAKRPTASLATLADIEVLSYRPTGDSNLHTRQIVNASYLLRIRQTDSSYYQSAVVSCHEAGVREVVHGKLYGLHAFGRESGARLRMRLRAMRVPANSRPYLRTYLRFPFKV